MDWCGLYFRPEDLLTEDERVSVDVVDRDTNQCKVQLRIQHIIAKDQISIEGKLYLIALRHGTVRRP